MEMQTNTSGCHSDIHSSFKSLMIMTSIICAFFLVGCANTLEGDSQEYLLTKDDDLIVYRVDRNEKVTVTGELGADLDDDTKKAEELQTVEIRIPKTETGDRIREVLEAAKGGGTINTYDLLIIARGSVYGGRCHDQGGDEHCHPNY